MEQTSARIIDANANRAREAIRVMEDIARFGLDHEALCAGLKQLRHDLAEALDALPGARAMVAHRDTQGDVGTGVTTAREGAREDVRAVAVAAGKRLTEALRSIEEAAKTVGGGGAFEALRYRAYALEQVLLVALIGRGGEIVGVCVLVTESLCAHHPWEEVARGAADAGATMLQLREKDLPDRDLLARARKLVEIGRERGVRVIVNDRPDIAACAKADGVHLGQEDLPVMEARKIVGAEMLVGVSTACIEDARRALQDGADYCGVGPMFPTTTKHKPVISGPDYLRAYLAHEPRLPAGIAIGGIDAENVGILSEAGARAVAVSSAVCRARDPGAVCAKLVKILKDGQLSGAKMPAAG